MKPARSLLVLLLAVLPLAAQEADRLAIPALERDRRAIADLAEPLDQDTLDLAGVEQYLDQLRARREPLRQAYAAAAADQADLRAELAATDDAARQADLARQTGDLADRLADAATVLERFDLLVARLEKKHAQQLDEQIRVLAKSPADRIEAALLELARWRERLAPHLAAVEAELPAAEAAVEALGAEAAERDPERSKRDRLAHLQAAGETGRRNAELLEATVSDLTERKADEAVRGGLEVLETQVGDATRLQTMDLTDLNGLIADATRLRAEAAERERQAKEQRATTADRLAALGDQAADTDVQKAQRATLRKQLDSIDAALERYAAHIERADAIVGTLQRIISQVAARALVQQGDTLLEVIEANVQRPQPWVEFATRLSTEGTGLSLLNPWTFLLLAAVLAGCVWGGRRLRARLREVGLRLDDGSFTHELLRALALSLAVHGPWAFGLAVVALFMTWIASGAEHLPFVVTFSYLAVAWVVLRWIIRSLLSPPEPGRSVMPYPPDLAARLARGLSVLALLILLYWLIAFIATEFELADDQLFLVRFAFVTALTLDAAWLVRIESRLTHANRASRYVAVALLGVALVAEAFGYRSLATYLQEAVIFTLLAALAYIGIKRLLTELFDRVDQGGYAWARRLRETLSVRPDEPFPGLPMLRFVAGLALHVTGGLALLRIWALEAGYTAAVAYLNNGFAFGGLTIIPSRLLQGMLLFGLLMTLRSWTREALEQYLARNSRMDRGARDATLAIAGYLFFMVAVLTAVRVVGPEILRNVAVVAGALSVGIGFGLQNIVNNFVSGLILLFERQIKTGDWIVVGNTEGYVRRLSVRSTEIQTFQRAEVIVPNADLLQQHVINKTRHTSMGRVDVPVGVAYGTDVERVRELLLELGREHEESLDIDGFPTVFFIAFGESSLDFELRCMIRDVDKSVRVRSDLLFAINAAFAEQGIEIPFPQRDVHVRNLPEGAQPHGD